MILIVHLHVTCSQVWRQLLSPFGTVSTVQKASCLRILIEPSDSLEEGLLFSKFEELIGQIATNSEAVLDTTIESELIRNGEFLFQDMLRLVTLVSGEDIVRFCCNRKLVVGTEEFGYYI